jgi:hypothetical protein
MISSMCIAKKTMYLRKLLKHMILPTSLNKCQFRLSRINSNKYIGIYGIKLVKLGIIRAGRWGLARRARGVSGFHLLKSSHNCDSKFN